MIKSIFTLYGNEIIYSYILRKCLQQFQFQFPSFYLIHKLLTNIQLFNFHFSYTTCKTGWQKHAVLFQIYVVNLSANGLPTTIPNCPDVIQIPNGISAAPMRLTHWDKQLTGINSVSCSFVTYLHFSVQKIRQIGISQ